MKGGWLRVGAASIYLSEQLLLGHREVHPFFISMSFLWLRFLDHAKNCRDSFEWWDVNV